ncbi:sister chromatid cohesion C-terminus-domain-containing protein [Tribonema minus]|uniref:Sister chromatid cohesion protein n=1 Tax=Tribonema minus TaxID=303371 RepID=A0A835Z2V2_9STRA|nr:sister chromatid cohesion C-terminus-domain-containing protein [Tribonema minus]
MSDNVPVELAVDTEGLIGRRITREFDDLGFFSGTVQFAHAMGAQVVYRIVYEDGDEEDLEFEQVQECLVDDNSATMVMNQSSLPPAPMVVDTAVSPPGSQLPLHVIFKERIDELLLDFEADMIADRTTNQYDGSNAPPPKVAAAGDGMSLPASALQQLCKETSKLKHSKQVSSVDVPTMERLMVVLRQQMESAVSINLYKVEDEEDVRGEISVVTAGLDAAYVALMVLTSDSIGKRLVSDDVIDAAIQLVSHHLADHIKMAFNGQQPQHTSSKRLLRPVTGTFSRMCDLLECLGALVGMVDLQDSFVLRLSPLAMTILQLEELPREKPRLWPLQRAAINLLQAVFVWHEPHRKLLLDDIFGLLLKLPTTKRQLRTFKLAEPTRVQVASALIMLLMQSLVQVPPMPSEEDSSEAAGAGLAGASAMSRFFAARFIARCQKKEDDGQEFRRLLVNLVDDLVSALPFAEWPAAELLLHAFCKALITDLPKMAQHAVFMALDILTKVATAVAALQREEHDNPISMPCNVPQAAAPPPKAGERFFACGCEVEGECVAALDCDRCHRWFHAACAGIASLDQAPSHWYCGDCVILQQLERQKQVLAHQREQSGEGMLRLRAAVEATSAGNGGTRANGQQEAGSLSQYDAMRQLLLNALSKKAGDPWARQARQVHVAQWAAEELKAKHSDLAEHFLQQWEPPAATVVNGSLGWTEAVLNAEPQARLARHLLVHRELCSAKGLQFLLQHTMAMLSASASGVRCRVVKGLSGVVGADPALMGLEMVRHAMEERFHDESISVREAAVNMVGQYVLQGGPDGVDLLETYHRALMERLVDVGVSVRKSVVRTLRGCLSTYPCHKRRSEICSALVERSSIVKEEDTIRDIIRDTFQDLWFSEPAPKDEALSQGEQQQHVEACALQMMEVAAEVKSRDWLVVLIRGLIFGPAEGDKGRADSFKHREVAMGMCHKLVAALVEFLLRLDEGTPLNCKLDTSAQQLLATITLLHVFSSAYPQLLVPHVDTLYPYLKGENGLTFVDESQLCLGVSDVIKQVVPLLPRPDLQSLQQVVADLKRLAYRFGSAVVQSSIECLACIVGQVTHDPSPIMDLLEKCYSYLFKYHRAAKGVDPKFLQRALIITGHVCRFHSLKPSASLDLELQQEEEGGSSQAADGLLQSQATDQLPPQLPQDGALRVVYNILRLFASKGALFYRDAPTAIAAEVQAKALQALSSLLVGSPRLMLLAQKHGLVGGALDQSKGHTARALAQALCSWRHVLVAEEERVESGAARETMEAAGISVAQRVRGDQDSESSVVGGVLQLHVPAVRRLLYHENVEGLVDPLETVPHLVALQSDPAAPVRSEAMRQIMVEDEKRRDVVQMRVMDGMFLAYAWTAAAPVVLLPADDPISDAHGPSSVFSAIYSTCIQQAFGARNVFLRHVTSLFEERSRDKVKVLMQTARDRLHQHASTPALQTATAAGAGPSVRQRRQSLLTKQREGGPGIDEPLQLRLLWFLAMMLAHLPYDKEEEPLLVIYHINKIVSLYGSEIALALRRQMGALGLPLPSNDSDDDDVADMTDGSEGASGTGAAALKCSSAAAMCMLLQLKHHLKQTHHLSDARCQAFAPSETTAKGEHTLSRQGQHAAMGLQTPPLLPPGWQPTPEAVVSQFEQLRRLLREDPADFAVSSTAPGSTAAKRAKKEPGTSAKSGAKRARASDGKSKKKKAAKKRRSAAKVVVSDESGDDYLGEDDME